MDIEHKLRSECFIITIFNQVVCMITCGIYSGDVTEKLLWSSSGGEGRWWGGEVVEKLEVEMGGAAHRVHLSVVCIVAVYNFGLHFL